GPGRPARLLQRGPADPGHPAPRGGGLMRRFGPWSLALPAAAYFVVSLTWLQAQRPRAALSEAAPGSALDTSPRGMSLAYGYLKRRAAGADLLRRPIDDAAGPRDAVVLRIRPRSPFVLPAGVGGQTPPSLPPGPLRDWREVQRVR